MYSLKLTQRYNQNPVKYLRPKKQFTVTHFYKMLHLTYLIGFGIRLSNPQLYEN